MQPGHESRVTSHDQSIPDHEQPTPAFIRGNGDALNRSPAATDSCSPDDDPQGNDARGNGARGNDARGNGARGKDARGDDSARHWDERPLALADGPRLRAVTAAAARFRIRAGMPVTEAQARCATLVVLPWDDEVIDRAVRETSAAFLAASPQVTPVAGVPGTWWVGATGLDALGGEPALAQTLRDLACSWHPGARVAIADSCVAARAGTWETRDEERGTRDENGRGKGQEVRDKERGLADAE
jgi:hypothetical protein